MDIAVLVALLNAASALVETVIKSQPADVQARLWERHMTATEPLYAIVAKVATALDAKLEPKA